MKRADTEVAAATTSRLDVMNFLNEMSGNFPQAISFGSGRPTERFFDMERWIGLVPAFARHFAAGAGVPPERAMLLLAQYGRTGGVIDDLIARQVGRDEGIECERGQVIVTAGCQEAIELCMGALFQDARDVLLVKSPAYIGITGVAELHGVATAAFSCEDPEDTAGALRATVARLEAEGKRPRALYLVPDFDNPTGAVLSLGQREAVLDYCAGKGITVLEDNPYGMFRYDGERLPTMFGLDRHGCVIYLGTYSKTICPALRIGFALLPKALHGNAAASAALMTRLLQAKSLLTVNTSQVAQAIAGGLLLDQDCSLQELVAPSLALYKSNRDCMLAALDEVLSPLGAGISWNRPEGGFFLTVSLPFTFLGEDANVCARDFGVLAMPLSFFALDNAQDCRLRLAFSNVTHEQIGEGVARLGRYVAHRLAACAQPQQD